MSVSNGSGKKLVTFSSLDMKLRRLLIWYLQHKDDVLPEHQQHINSQFRLFDIFSKNKLKLIDITTMKYSEKNALLIGLLKANMTWKQYKKLVDNRQQPITKFFKPKTA
jgi:hypothetical protein|mmetsp:Transcript_3680/g.6148  ORF Transcript_3680/g.6148 Transcript_3680/m.6148 type:complete len:109 (+) Transcript_3680:153-479(+)